MGSFTNSNIIEKEACTLYHYCINIYIFLNSEMSNCLGVFHTKNDLKIVKHPRVPLPTLGEDEIE